MDKKNLIIIGLAVVIIILSYLTFSNNSQNISNPSDIDQSILERQYSIEEQRQLEKMNANNKAAKKRIEESAGKRYEDMSQAERWGNAAKNLTLDLEIPCSSYLKQKGEC